VQRAAADGHGLLGALERILQRDRQPRAAVGRWRRATHAPEGIEAAAGTAPAHAAEHLRKEVREAAGVAAGHAAASAAEGPARRRRELLAGLPVGAERVVGAALLRVAEHL